MSYGVCSVLLAVSVYQFSFLNALLSCLCGLEQPALHRGERQNMLFNYNNNDEVEFLLKIDRSSVCFYIA